MFLKRARASVASVWDYELDVLMDVIDAFAAKLEAHERVLHARAARHEPVRRLMTIPGFGAFTAITVFAGVGDARRFRNADQLAAYFGLVPTETPSGEPGVRALTRKGSSLVRALLNQAVWSHGGVARAAPSCGTSSTSPSAWGRSA